MITTPTAIVSNGFGQFHLARLAEKLHESGKLHGFLTGAYPKGLTPRLLSNLSHVAAINRLAEREIRIPGALIRGCWSGELPHQIAQMARNGSNVPLVELSTAFSMDMYSKWARRQLRGMTADVYHYRAGMGGDSVKVAKELGMATVCDHSIAHPRLLQGLVDGTGTTACHLDALWSRVDADINRADWLLVNSDFVAETCIEAGFPADKISVAYTAVDPTFIKAIDEYDPDARWRGTKVLFAGTLEQRKGIDVVVDACRRLTTTSMTCSIVGEWLPDASESKHALPSNIRHKPKMPRGTLAKLMSETAIFLFPTRAEGSARVVAEALAAGCYVITTVNAGSVVRDGVDGRIVPVGDVDAVEAAVREYLDLSIGERKSRSSETRAYSRKRLSEDVYARGVADAYLSVSGRA